MTRRSDPRTAVLTGKPPARRVRGLALALAVAGLTVAFLAVKGIEAGGEHRVERLEPIFFPRAEILRPALLGFAGLAADLTWIRTVQYFGSRIERQERFPQLYQLVDMVTSLDPQFLDAYQYGGLFLSIARQYPNAIAIFRTTWAGSTFSSSGIIPRPCTGGRSPTDFPGALTTSHDS
jgi:hypothetical protein